MEKFLNAGERKKLLMRHRKERDKRICDRIKAVLAYDEGYSYTGISKILLLDDETIRRYINDYVEVKKLKPTNGGSEGKLTKYEKIALIKHLKENTYLYVKDICVYVKKTYNKNYSVSGMTKWLQNNEFRYKKPHGVPAKADKKKQEEFIEYYNKLKEETKGKEPIYFADSVHPQHQTHLAYGWIYKGIRKEIAMTGRQYRMNFMGGICLDNYKIVYKSTDKVETNSIKQFFIKVRKNHPDKIKIHMILDNAGYHKSHEVKIFAKELNIDLHYLPPYSPNLNPIERLWKIMHEHVSYNKYYEKFSEFSEATLHFFRHIGKKKKLLRTRITDNFQIINSPLFAT